MNVNCDVNYDVQQPPLGVIQTASLIKGSTIATNVGITVIFTRARKRAG